MLIRANADTMEQAQAAVAAGASGIGLCRTESMLLGPGRLPLMRAIASATDERCRNAALAELTPLHRADIEAMLRVVAPNPMYVRLLDPPLQDFLPSLQQIEESLSDARADENWDEMLSLGSMRSKHATMIAVNPSMGHRGCRLSLTHPEIFRMQVTAILEAAVEVAAEGYDPKVCILIPLVASEEETRVLARTIRDIAGDIATRSGREAPYKVGVLIELPRAAICAGAISRHVDLVSFGTNDLTQMTYGFSKEDTKAYLDCYLDQGIFKQNPFVSLDREGVGHLLSFAVASIRKRSPAMEIGACGDHAADPESLLFLQSLGISFVSCKGSLIKDASQAIDALEIT